MTDHTAHFRFEIPDFNQEPWHAELENAIRSIDTAIYEALLTQSVDIWLNSTTYAVGAIVIDSATGLMWTCAVANTSSASPTTFAQERVAHPTYWNATANIPQQRGTWVTATSYIPGDFVVDTNRYAVCLVAHVSGVFNTDLAAAKWVVLIDLSTLGVGLNATAEDTIASAGTTDIGSKTATRLNVTGAATITSLGVVANTYKILRFAAGITLTNNANVILFGANILTELNDIAFFSSDATGKWRMYFYSRASGVPIGQPDASETVKGIAELATQAEVNTGTDDLRIVTPLKMVTYVSTAISTAITNIINGAGATLDTLGEIATAIGTLAPKANPTFTGTTTIADASVTNLTVATGLTLPAGSVESVDLEAKARAFGTQFYQVRDEQNSGTDGAALVSIGAWNTAPLNTEKQDNLTIANPSSNQISLAAGTYYVEAEGTAFYTGTMDRASGEFAALMLRLRNITDGATLLNGVTVRFSILDDGGGNNQAAAFTLLATMKGWFTIAGTKTIELQKWIGNTFTGPAATGGKAATTGEKEVYSDLRLWKIG